MMTTCDPMIHPETKTRFIISSLDESKEQTRRILDCQRKNHTLAGLQGDMEKEAILKKHQDFQRLLKCLPVINPYADQLTYSDERLTSRRNQPLYLNIIRAVAFLRQMNKPAKQAVRGRQTTNYIEVDLEDIRIGNDLAQNILGRCLDDLSHPSRELLLLIEEMAGQNSNGDKSFSRRDVREFTGWSDYRIRISLKEITDLEYIRVTAGRNGSPYRYELVSGDHGGRAAALSLKSTDELDLADLARPCGAVRQG